MAVLDTLEGRIKEKLAFSDEHRRRQQDRLQRGMDDLAGRRERCAAALDRLMQAVIRPRMQKLGECFENARAPQNLQGPHGCIYRFERTARFPATATLAIGVEKSEDAFTIEVLFEPAILPPVVKPPGPAQLFLPFDLVDEGMVGDWVADRIVAFLDAYLRLETTEAAQAETVVADPVCGMRLNKTDAPARMEYRGVVYHFCVEECRRRFSENPERYLPSRPDQS